MPRSCRFFEALPNAWVPKLAEFHSSDSEKIWRTGSPERSC
ncbi:MAG: hypothetical protein ACJA1W_002131 [Akkermansiaceae bacterium]